MHQPRGVPTRSRARSWPVTALAVFATVIVGLPATAQAARPQAGPDADRAASATAASVTGTLGGAATSGGASAASVTGASGGAATSGGASATSVTGASGGAATSGEERVRVEPLCGQPQPGEVTCFGLRRTDVPSSSGVRPFSAAPRGYGATDLRDAYGLPDGGGAGATIAVVLAYDNPNAEADLAVYREQYGLPPCTTANGCFRKVDQRGGTDYPEPDPGWAAEAALDLDMVSAIAPQAHLLLVEADGPEFAEMGAAVDQAVAQGAKYVSNSYGTRYTSEPGSGEHPTLETEFGAHYDHPGVAMVAASGDYDYGVSYPASSRHVTAVGGTALVKDDSPRGWSESVWSNEYGGTGSGCSSYEPKPGFQTDAGCANRSVADVAAVADPLTGVAVYHTYGHSGWGISGGTSASSPIIAAVYAVAGTPAAGTYPNAYPYANTAALHDVTSGHNGTCKPAYLCTAGKGYDGPTGLGTPNGAVAFKSGPHGTITGTVTDATTGKPLPGVSVRGGTTSATTGPDGRYSLHLPAGGYDVTASLFGYGSATVTGVTVADGGTATAGFALAPLPSARVSGVVTDGSGHGWPLPAKVTVAGMPGAVYTDPVTGRYSLNLPRDHAYRIRATPAYDGYQAAETTVTVVASGVTANIAAPVDVLYCSAPGYRPRIGGRAEPFDAATAPAGWAVDNGDHAGGWDFTDPGQRSNLTGGSGGFAIVDSDYLGVSQSQDTTLTAPAVDFSDARTPVVSFDTEYKGMVFQDADVELSTDGGATWASAAHLTLSYHGEHLTVPLPEAAGKPGVLVRFHFATAYGMWWQVDNVAIGEQTCEPVPGGLVVGQVTDATTGAGVVGAEVGTPDAADAKATTVATPENPYLGDGFYAFFSPVTGVHPIKAGKDRYAAATAAVDVFANGATRADLALRSGRLEVRATGTEQTVDWGSTGTATITVKNTGTAPATVTVTERPAGVDLFAKSAGAPLQEVPGDYSALPERTAGKSGTDLKPAGTAKPAGTDMKPAGTAKPAGTDMKPAGTAKPAGTDMKAAGTAGKSGGPGRAGAAAARAAAAPAAEPWTQLAQYPTKIQDNVAGLYGGKLYSGFGWTGSAVVSTMYVYDPVTGEWSQKASAKHPRQKPGGAFIGGRFYVVGGWNAYGDPEPALDIYDPSTDTWSTGAPIPTPRGAPGVAVLAGKLYVVGGCERNVCGKTDVQVYDPVTDGWETAARYPEPVAWESCGGIRGTLYCSGGTTQIVGATIDGSLPSTYAYDPLTDSWTRRADMPLGLWGAAYTAANGLLLVAGGVFETRTESAVTNRGFAYDPTRDTWTTLPNANSLIYRGAGACGFYRVGGNTNSSNYTLSIAEVLPGFADCDDTDDSPWLSADHPKVTVQPGTSTDITVTLDAAGITQPGRYAARLALGMDTPHPGVTVPVAVTVNPPPTWGKLVGVVTSAADGAPLPGATIQVDTWAASYTIKTDARGEYSLWLDYRHSPIQLIAARDGYQPQVRTVNITQGSITTASFRLKKS